MSNPETIQQPAQPATPEPAENGGNGIPAPAGQRTAADYKGRIAPIWCPGCGNYAVLSAMQKALANLEVDPDLLAVVSGIGCSSRMPGFVKCYGYHGAHGRALPAAIGLKCGNPRMTVLVVGGDGDGLSIGMGHFAHALRRNVDLTYLLLDNRIYGLTKGQASPTTCQGTLTKSSPQGVLESPMSPVRIAIGFDASFVARAYSGQPKQLQAMIEAAIQHKGFSLVQVLSPCVTFGKGSGFDFFGPRVKPLPDGHDTGDMYGAMKASDDTDDTIYTGIFFRRESPEYIDQLQAGGGARGRELDATQEPQIDVDALIERFS
jgi:2-oxoglutarate ferredoxin oxidoreductase subunit beta